MNMLRQFIILLWLVTPAQADFRFLPSSDFSSAGRVLISLGQVDLSGAFMNFAKNFFATIFNGGNPGTLTIDNYPKNGTLAQALVGIMPIPTTDGTMVLSWSGAGAFTISADATPTEVSAGCSSPGGGIQASGTDCRIKFVFNAPISLVTLSYPAGTTYNNFTNLVIARLSDEAAIIAGQHWLPEYVSTLRQLNPSALRTMGFSHAGGNNLYSQTKWAYRARISSQVWGKQIWFPGLWAGAATGTNIYTLGPAPDTPVVWTEGEAFQMSVANAASTPLSVSAMANNGSNAARVATASTSSLTTGQRVLLINSSVEAYNGQWVITVIDGTHFDLQGSTFTATSTSLAVTTTIDVNGRGPKFIVSNNNQTSSFVSPISANSIGTGIYDSIVDWVWYSNNNAMFTGVPIEVQVQLANLLNIPLWYNLSEYADDDLVTQTVTYVRDNLVPTFKLEFSNELWNQSFAQGFRSAQRGLYLGWLSSNNAARYSYIGLRTRQVMGVATAAWTPRVLAQMTRMTSSWTFAAKFLSIGQLNDYIYKGTLLSAYSSADCPQNYATSPCRPVDYADAFPITQYFGGAQAGCTATNNTYDGATYAEIAGLISAATSYAAGDTATAFAFVDNDVRQGTRSGSGTPGLATLEQLALTIYTPWNDFITNNYPTKISIGYEGSFCDAPPTIGWLTTEGDPTPSTTQANIANMLIAYRLTPLAYRLTIDAYTQYLAFSNTRTAAWLALLDGNQFALLPGNVLPQPLQTWQVFMGMSAFNRGQN